VQRLCFYIEIYFEKLVYVYNIIFICNLKRKHDTDLPFDAPFDVSSFAGISIFDQGVSISICPFLKNGVSMIDKDLNLN
jgi:hypothetical protein